MLEDVIVVQSAISAFNNAALLTPAFLWYAILALPLFVVVFACADMLRAYLKWNMGNVVEKSAPWVEGQGALGQQDLPGLGHGGQGNAQESREIFAPEHLLEHLGPHPGAAEDQRGEVVALVMGQVRGGGVHVAAVAGELLGGHGQQLLRGAVLGIAGAAEGVHIDHGPALQAAAEILPLADEIAELTGDEARLEHGVQTHAHLLHPRPGGTVEV